MSNEEEKRKIRELFQEEVEREETVQKEIEDKTAPASLDKEATEAADTQEKKEATKEEITEEPKEEGKEETREKKEETKEDTKEKEHEPESQPGPEEESNPVSEETKEEKVQEKEVSPEEMESKIDAAVKKIVTETVGDTPVPERTGPPRNARGMVQTPVKKKKKGLKIAGLSFLLVLVAAGCAYGAGTYYYSDKFFDGTVINGFDCSRMTAYEVEQVIADKVENYSITVKARNSSDQSISGESINYEYASDGEVLKLLKEQKPYEWVKGFFQKKEYATKENISFDVDLLQQQVSQLECAKEENQVAPQNAYVAFQDSQFVIVPEDNGSTINVREAYNLVMNAVAKSEEEVNLDQEGVYQTAELTQDSETLKNTLTECNNLVKASITYTIGDATEVLDGNIIKDWLTFDEKGQLVDLDTTLQTKVTEYVASLASKYDTYGKDQTFHSTSGRDVVVMGYTYGWQINQQEEAAQLLTEIKGGQQVNREPVYSSRAAAGNNGFGDTYVELDLSAQHMYVYQGGALALESDFVSGNMSYSDRQTPAGVYRLYYKKSPDVLRGKQRPDGSYEYEEPVTFWMPFNGGVGLHDAPWRSSFGGDIYLTGGSHGCINLPYAAAEQLYGIINSDMPIICFY